LRVSLGDAWLRLMQGYVSTNISKLWESGHRKFRRIPYIVLKNTLCTNKPPWEYIYTSITSIDKVDQFYPMDLKNSLYNI